MARKRPRILMADERPALNRALRDLGAEIILAGKALEPSLLECVAADEDVDMAVAARPLAGVPTYDGALGDEALLAALNDAFEKERNSE